MIIQRSHKGIGGSGDVILHVIDVVEHLVTYGIGRDGVF
jgi:hypothetical protein